MKKIRFVIISDDWYYLLGMKHILLADEYRKVEIFFTGYPSDLSAIYNLTSSHDGFFDVIILAVDDFNLLKKIQGINLFFVFASIRQVKKVSPFPMTKKCIFLSRYTKINIIFNLISINFRSDLSKPIKLTESEKNALLLHFILINEIYQKKLLQRFNYDGKKISFFKLAAFKKFGVSCDSDFLFILRVLVIVRCEFFLSGERDNQNT